MLKILLTSDLHRGFSDKTHRIHARFAETLAALDWDVLVLAGDLASHKRHQFQGVMKWARELSGAKPVLCVRGNHDYWDTDKSRPAADISLIRDDQERWFSEYGVHHLERGPFKLNGHTFVGWDGWWHNEAIDLWRIPSNAYSMPTDVYLKHRCGVAFGDALLAAEIEKPDKIIAVTHFPVAPNDDFSYGGNPRHWEFLQPHLHALCYGHSHRRRDEVIDGVRVLNAGSDYDRPDYILFDLSEKR